MTDTNSTTFEAATYVYAIGRKGSNSQVKIGHSKSPSKRMASLQAASGRRLELIHTIACPDKATAYNLEMALHYWLKFYRRGGEWFSNRVRPALVPFCAIHFGSDNQSINGACARWSYKPIERQFLELRDMSKQDGRRDSKEWQKRLDKWVKADRLVRLHERTAKRNNRVLPETTPT